MIANNVEPVWVQTTDKKSAKKLNPNEANTKTWKGEVDGEYIFGKVEDFKEVTRKDGTKAHVLNLYNDVFNEYYTVWARGMLLRLLEAAEVESGKVIKIEFEGFKPMKTQPDRSYRSYKVFVAEAQ